MQNANCGISPVKPSLYQRNKDFSSCIFQKWSFLHLHVHYITWWDLTPSNYQSMFKHYLIEPAFFKLISASFLIVSKRVQENKSWVNPTLTPAPTHHECLATRNSPYRPNGHNIDSSVRDRYSNRHRRELAGDRSCMENKINAHGYEFPPC